MSITHAQPASRHQGDLARIGGELVSSEEKPPPAPSCAISSGRVLFEVPFATALTDPDLAQLTRRLALSTRSPAMSGPRNSPRRHNVPGFVRLDHDSGLFLRRAAVDGDWLLEARTWGAPAAQAVQRWHVLAAGAARELDPTVNLPRRLEPDARTIPDRPLGRAANKRLAGFRRRLVGLP